MPTKLHVTHVLNSTSGGSAASTLQLIDALKEHGVTSSLICFENGTPQIRQQITDRLEGRALFRPLFWTNKRIRTAAWKRPLVEGKSWLETLGGKRFLKEFTAFARSHSTDLIHSSTLVTAEGPLLARKLGIPHLYHGRELIGPGQPYQFYRFDRWVKQQLAASSAIIANSQVTLANYKQFFPEQHLRYIPNGVPVNSFTPKFHEERTPVVVGMVGNLTTRWKDHPRLVDLALACLERGLPVEFRMYGQLPNPEDEYVRGMREKIEKAGAESQIRMMGFVSDPALIMQELDILVHATPHESFGRIFVEAMAGGLPLVAAKGGGALDLVRPNETGYLFETNSDAVEALTRLVEQPDLRNQLGQTGRKVAEQEFEIHRVAEQVRALYDEILPG